MENKIVVITGGSRGLGKAMAEIFASKKAKVILSDRDSEELEKVSKEIHTLPVVADVTKEDEMFKLAQSAVFQFGKIDIWINNAGVWLPRAPIEEVDMKRAHDLFEVNVFGTIYGSRAALGQMKKQGYGTIINIISRSALGPRPNSAIYSASKHAAKGFTDALRGELEDKGILVIGIFPSGIKTNLFLEQRPEEFGDFMSPESVAEKIVENLEKAKPEIEMLIERPGQP